MIYLNILLRSHKRDESVGVCATCVRICVARYAPCVSCHDAALLFLSRLDRVPDVSLAPDRRGPCDVTHALCHCAHTHNHYFIN